MPSFYFQFFTNDNICENSEIVICLCVAHTFREELDNQLGIMLNFMYFILAQIF